MVAPVSYTTSGDTIQAQSSGQHHAPAVAAALPGTQSNRKHLAVHARQLALEPHLRPLRQHLDAMLRSLEQARGSPRNHHIHRNATMAEPVVISAGWYDVSKRLNHEN